MLESTIQTSIISNVCARQTTPQSTNKRQIWSRSASKLCQFFFGVRWGKGRIVCANFGIVLNTMCAWECRRFATAVTVPHWIPWMHFWYGQQYLILTLFFCFFPYFVSSHHIALIYIGLFNNHWDRKYKRSLPRFLANENSTHRWSHIHIWVRVQRSANFILFELNLDFRLESITQLCRCYELCADYSHNPQKETIHHLWIDIFDILLCVFVLSKLALFTVRCMIFSFKCDSIIALNAPEICHRQWNMKDSIFLFRLCWFLSVKNFYMTMGMHRFVELFGLHSKNFSNASSYAPKCAKKIVISSSLFHFPSFGKENVVCFNMFFAVKNHL